MGVKVPAVGARAVVGVVQLVAGVGGIALVSYGAWLHYRPLGFAVGGALLFVVAVLGALRAK